MLKFQIALHEVGIFGKRCKIVSNSVLAKLIAKLQFTLSRSSSSQTVMYSSVFLPILKSHLIACRIHMCLPFNYSSKSERLVRSNSVLQVSMSQFQCILSMLYCFAMSIVLFFGNLVETEKFQASVFFMLNLLACITRWSNTIDNDAIQIINSFLEFEHTALQGSTNIKLHKLSNYHINYKF